MVNYVQANYTSVYNNNSVEAEPSSNNDQDEDRINDKVDFSILRLLYTFCLEDFINFSFFILIFRGRDTA